MFGPKGDSPSPRESASRDFRIATSCGNDDICHSPGGSFRVTADIRWTSRTLLVGDTTGDELPELVGVSDQAIVAHLGAADGAYVASVTVPNLQVFDDPEVARLIEKIVVPSTEQNLDNLSAEVLVRA